MSAYPIITEPEAEILPRQEVGSMLVDAIVGRNRVLSGARNPVRMVVRVLTPKVEESLLIRPPLRVACVMDCSGSMGGAKLTYAKKAVLKLVKHLSATDTLHFVSYDSAARVVFQNGDLSEAGKEVLRQQIEAIQAGGQTNLCGGLDVAAKLLGAAAHSGSAVGSMRRIFLFSDGRVNVGTTHPIDIRTKVAAWAADGITTGSFGIGADFDEPLMRGIAASGLGRYQFLATAQDIPKLVSKSVHDLIAAYASDAVLDIRGCEHTIVTCVHGNHEDGGGTHATIAPGQIHLGDIHSDSLRAIMVELDVAPPGNAQEGVAFNSIEWCLKCQRNGVTAQFSGQVQLSSTRDRASLGDEAPTVHMAFSVRRATELEHEVAEHLTRRDRQAARDVKAKQMALLEEALQAGQQRQRDHGDVTGELDLITVVLERARNVARRLADEDEDEELMARQCWQDRDDFSCASFCDLRDRANSSVGGDDVGDLRDFENHMGGGASFGSGFGDMSASAPPGYRRKSTGVGSRLVRRLRRSRLFQRGSCFGRRDQGA